MMKVFIVILILVLGQNVVESGVNDRLRDFMMDLSIFKRADLDLGLAMEVVGIRLLGILPRMALWSLKNMNVKIIFNAPTQFEDEALVQSINYPAALSMLINVEVPQGNYAGIQNMTGTLLKTDAIPNYLQGILLTSFFALIPLLFTWCCCCCICCGLCNGLIKCLIPCCRCNVRWKNKIAYNLEYNTKCFTQLCCKLEWCMFSLCIVLAMLFWGYFTYLSHVGVSQALDTFRNDTDTVVGWVGEVMDVPNKADSILLTLEITWNSTVDEVIKILPIGDALIPHIQCIDNITNGLPDLKKVAEFVKTVNASVHEMPDLSQFDDLSANISFWLDKMQREDLVALEEGMAQITDSVDSIPIQLGLLKTEIEQIDRMKEAFPDSEDIDTLTIQINKIEHVQNDVLTDAFITEFKGQMDSPESSTTDAIAANIRTFQYAIGVIDSIDFDAMDSILAAFATAKDLAPDGDKIIDLINGLNTILESIDLDPIREGLAALNDSFNGLATELEGIDPMLVELNATLMAKFPSFAPLDEELAKINSTIETAKCIQNITDMIVRINSTVLIMPYAISMMVVSLSNMTQTFQNDINFDESLGAVTDMKKTVSGQLQENIASMRNQTTDEMLAGLPDINAIFADVERADADIMNGSSAFNVSDFLTVMQDMNDSLSSIDDVSEFRTSISDVQNSTASAVAMNESMSLMAETLEAFPAGTTGFCPDPTVCTSLKTVAQDVKDSSDSVDVTALRDTVSSFNDTLTDLPSAAEYTDKISELNNTVANMPNLGEMEQTISEANDTIEELSVTGFSDNVDTFSESMSEFDLSAIMDQLERVSGIYDTFNQSNLLEQFNLLNDLIDPVINVIPQSLQSLRYGQVGALNETVVMVNGWVDIVVGYKDMVIEGYVVNYDGYRLLAACLIILMFLPCPGIICLYCLCPMAGACCHFMCMKCLLCCACFCWIFPVVGIPFAVGMESLCTGVDGALGNAVDELGNVLSTINATEVFGASGSTIEQLNVSMLFTDGFSSEWAENYVNSNIESLTAALEGTNMTLNTSFDFNFETVRLKELLLNYIYDNEDESKGPVACTEADLLDVGKIVINSSVYSLLDAFGDALLGFEFNGFRIHPQFPITLRGIFLPAFLNLTDVIDQAKPIMGCPAIHSLWMILFDFSCERVRYGSMFLWGMLTVCAMIFTGIACRGLSTYCCFCTNYTSTWDKRKRNKMRKEQKKCKEEGTTLVPIKKKKKFFGMKTRLV